jgi:hypothetical protein
VGLLYLFFLGNIMTLANTRSGFDLEATRAALVRIIDHLTTQKKQSRGDNGCLYRGPENCMCAIGVLIPDTMYHECLEGGSIYRLKYQDPVSEIFKHLKTDLLNDLQSYHDNAVTASHEAYSYAAWLAGAERSSPERLMSALAMKHHLGAM